MAKNAKPQTPKHRNAYVVAMLKRHPRAGRIEDRRQRRSKDARKSWRRDWD